MSRREREPEEAALLPEGAIVLPGAALFAIGCVESAGLAHGRGVRDAGDGAARATLFGKTAYTASMVDVVAPPRGGATTATAGAAPAAAATGSGGVPEVSLSASAPAASALATIAPAVGATVLFRVTKVHSIGAAGPIVAINDRWCLPTFRGVVRLDDIRAATAKQIAAGQIPTHAGESFRLGDLVCADVTSLTEARQFQLTTTPNHCGVVRVFSERKTDGRYRCVPGRRDQVVVDCERSGLSKTISRWVPDETALKTLTVRV